MHKKRLIFTLLYNDGFFMLSRNFRLQKVGNVQWIEEKYNFKKIAFAIDELIILNVGRTAHNRQQFIADVSKLTQNVFVPIALGGGINDLEYAKTLFLSGADKIVVNSVLTENQVLINEMVREFGSQAIIASVDYLVENEMVSVFTHNGSKKKTIPFHEYLEYIQQLKVGELYLNSIRKDGTGQGFDIEIMEPYLKQLSIPVIMAGGAGNAKHLIEGAKNNAIDAVATANLFNFIGNSLPLARAEMQNAGVNLANFAPIE